MATPESSAEVVRRLRQVRTAAQEPIAADQIAAILSSVIDKWRARDFPPRRETVTRISRNLGFSVALLDESLDALLMPFTRAALSAFASSIVPRRETVGFVMAGNVAGSGLHEVAIALMAGCGLVIKTATREPFFFDALARTLVDEAPALGGRISVLNWDRARADLTDALRRDVDLLIAYGDDATMDALGRGARMIAFGSKVSGAFVSRSALNDPDDPAVALARDVTLFEQLGCLSPHHIFVESGEVEGARFADRIAASMRGLAQRLPAAHLQLEDAAALRSLRENARWRSIAGDPVRLIEGPDLSWTVVFDRDARFTASPGLRCVYVTPVRDCADLRSRLEPARGRLEAFALAGGVNSDARSIFLEAGVSCLAEPGAMQSPPLTWRHGGAIFLDRMTSPQ